MGEVGGQQRLPDAADGAGAQHGLDALDDDGQFDAGLPGDFAEGVALETLEPVLGDGEDAGVDGIGERDGNWHGGL